MFIIQQKKRRNQSNGEGQQTRGRKKKGRRRSNRRCQCGGNLLHWVCSNHAFLLFFLSVFVPIEFLFSSRNVRYTPVRPVLSGIDRYLERYILKIAVHSPLLSSVQSKVSHRSFVRMKEEYLEK